MTPRSDKGMETGNGPSSVSIRPGVRILSLLRHLNYRPWFALGEFVDNALQSFLDYEDELREGGGDQAGLTVHIELESSDGGRIVVRDNAAGIHSEDFPRAFRPAEPPPDTTGLCEFGMGMKSAACWFARRWSVRTSALGEDVERTVTFDIENIINDRLDELGIQSVEVPRQHHYTEITLTGLHNVPRGRTLGKVRDHLASIYRVFLRQGVLHLYFNGEELAYEEPDVLEAPYFREPAGETRAWRREIEFDFGGGLSVSGFAALRRTASTSLAGFALFRRGRVIQGSGDETYRPAFIFGHSNSYAYQRLFGEFHLEGFDISHTKDGFRWEEHEEPFLQLLKEELNAEPLPLLRQAEGHRVRARPEELQTGAQEAAERTGEVIQREVPPVLSRLAGEDPVPSPPEALPEVTAPAKRTIELDVDGVHWQVTLELCADPGVSDWLSVFWRPQDPPARMRSGVKELGVRLSLVHPFMQSFGGLEAEKIEPLLRVACGLAMAEVIAVESGVPYPSTIRRNLNDLLGNALWRL